MTSGDLLRQAIREQSAFGGAYVDHGELVPDALMVQLIRERAAPDPRKR